MHHPDGSYANARSLTQLGRFSRGWLCAAGLTVCLLFVVPAQAQPLTPVPGSPFWFPYAQGSSFALPSPDGTHVFVTNQYSYGVSVLDVGVGGTLSYNRFFYLGWWPVKMTTNPSGTRLYVVCYGAIFALAVSPDGTLSYYGGQYTDPYANAEGIAYASAPGGGDFVYVNNQTWPNTVSAFPVLYDGSLGSRTDYSTGGSGGYDYWGAPSLAANGGRLYLLNGGTFSDTGSNDISVFNILGDGSVSPVAGSPFPLPPGTKASGALAIDPAGTAAYAGLTGGGIAKFAIGGDPFLSPVGTFDVCGGSYTGADGLAITPDGKYLAVALPHFDSDGADLIGIVHTATMSRVEGSPYIADQPFPGIGIESAIFNADGTRLIVGYNVGSYVTHVSAYDFTPTADAAPVEDLLPPTTTLSSWQSGCETYVYMLATDPDSCAPSTIHYMLDGGPDSIFIPYLLLNTGIGTHSLEYWSVDSSGNEESHHTTTVGIPDTEPPVTTATIYDIPGPGGWYKKPVNVYLNVTDPDSCTSPTIHWTVDGVSSSYTYWYASFTVSGEGIHAVTYWSEDQAGNTEEPHELSIPIDGTGPTITESVVLSRVKGQILASVSGKVTDAGSGIDPSSASFLVYDEYGQITPSGALTLKPDGSYAYKVTLGPPKATDKDGRTFEFVVKAKDMAGNAGSRTILVFVTKP